MKNHRMILYALAGVLVLFLAVNNVWAQPPSSVKIAVSAPLSGVLALPGQEMKEGADLASELINKKGGINGKTKIELIYGDDRCNPTEGVNATQRLIAQGIDFYIGNYCSSVALATMPVLAAEGIPQIVLAYAPSITAEARTPNSVRIGPNAPLEMAPVAKYAVTVNKDKKFAAMGTNNDHGRSECEAFAKAAEKLGGKVIDFQYYPFGADFSTYLTKVKNLGVDGVVIIALGNDTITFTKSYFELGLKMNIYGNAAFVDAAYLQKVKPKPQNLYYAEQYDDYSDRTKDVPPPEPWIQDFIKEFEAKYGKKPDRNNVWGYACVRIFEQAVAATGTKDKKKIAEYLHSGAKFKTPFGNFGFQWCGQSENKSLIGKYEGDKKLFLKPQNWGDDIVGDLCPPK
ncbi:MAG: ABC transporter substrate-binding protein [Pseudomonadota bacterium]